MILYTALTGFAADSLNARPRRIVWASSVLNTLSECCPCTQSSAGWAFSNVQVTESASLVFLDKRRSWSKTEEMLKSLQWHGGGIWAAVGYQETNSLAVGCEHQVAKDKGKESYSTWLRFLPECQMFWLLLLDEHYWWYHVGMVGK